MISENGNITQIAFDTVENGNEEIQTSNYLLSVDMSDASVRTA